MTELHLSIVDMVSFIPLLYSCFPRCLMNSIFSSQAEAHSHFKSDEEKKTNCVLIETVLIFIVKAEKECFISNIWLSYLFGLEITPVLCLQSLWQGVGLRRGTHSLKLSVQRDSKWWVPKGSFKTISTPWRMSD